MFRHDIYQYCLIIVLFTSSHYAIADIYKWVDDAGETHYSQLPPKDHQEVELIKAPPPPALDPNQAQQAIDELTAEQAANRQLRIEQQQQQQQTIEQQALRQKNCEIARHNLQQYRDNPGRRVTDAEGNVTRLQEEERQQKINEFQQNVNEFCQ